MISTAPGEGNFDHDFKGSTGFDHLKLIHPPVDYLWWETSISSPKSRHRTFYLHPVNMKRFVKWPWACEARVQCENAHCQLEYVSWAPQESGQLDLHFCYGLGVYIYLFSRRRRENEGITENFKSCGGTRRDERQKPLPLYQLVAFHRTIDFDLSYLPPS
jgi:hypothetical protein